HEVVGTDIVELADVRMVELINYLGLLREALAEPAGADLNRHLAVEPRTGRPVHLAHAARGHERLDSIRTQRLPRLQRTSRSNQLRRRQRGPGLACGVTMVCQQRRDLAMQLRIAVAGFAHESMAFRRVVLQRLLEQRLNLFPSLHSPLSPRRSTRGAAMPGQSSNPG